MCHTGHKYLILLSICKNYHVKTVAVGILDQLYKSVFAFHL